MGREESAEFGLLGWDLWLEKLRVGTGNFETGEKGLYHILS